MPRMYGRAVGTGARESVDTLAVSGAEGPLSTAILCLLLRFSVWLNKRFERCRER